MKYALIIDNIVSDIVMWDGNTETWAPADGTTAVKLADDSRTMIGDSYHDGVFTSPSTPNGPVIDFAAASTAYMATVRATRELILNRLAGIGVAALYAEDTATAAGVVAAREALLALPGLPSVTAATDIDSLKAAVLTAYRAAAGGAPVSVRAAFAAADS